jgi:hypothetical protein
MRAAIATLGFAPHSGWAAVVALGGPVADPRVLARSRVELAEPADPESVRPYHAVEDAGVEEAARRLGAYRRGADAKACEAIRAVTRALVAEGFRTASAAILASSRRKDLPLATILASHALIHSADGDHFRAALEAGATKCDLAVSQVGTRDLDARAEKALGRPAARLREAVKELGRQVGPPWGADQKSAALLAWMLLAEDDPRSAMDRRKR